MDSYIRQELNEAALVYSSLVEDKGLQEQLRRVAMSCIKCLELGGKVIFCGNGGSYSDSLHLSTELVARLRIDRGAISSCVLGANGACVTAVGNDYAFEEIFSRELEAVGKEGDVLIALSTSGSSKNVLKAVKVAKDMGIYAVGLTGRKGGLLSKECETLRVESTKTERIQEGHILMGHVICSMIERAFSDL